MTRADATTTDTFVATAGNRFADAVASRRRAPGGSARGTAGRLGRLLRRIRRHPGTVLAVVWLALVLISTVAPGLFTGQDPIDGVPAEKLTGPSTDHWFGTDQLGRDLFTRVVYGSALTLQAALIAVGIGLLLGSLLGLLAGFIGRWVDDVIMRISDVLLSIPALLLSLALITVLGFGTVNVAIAVGLGSVAAVSRIMRSEVIRVRNAVYVEAALASGNRWTRVLFRHVLPNSAGPVMVLAALEFGTAILAISALSFLGYGAQPPAPEWGSLVSTGRNFLTTAWWLTTLPGIVIALTVLAANAISRALDSDERRSR
ncbi:ABC transporter permease [Cryobacterium arcticum]|uniref:Peptide ABC transporter permease n=1 Tax=Cryobacterium arcticum TaxID=670052 RepID=A0A1B1BKU2_9MICO|nr:ABC transporter permease [Cryobacterium arcticum]ANP73151.1 peptide ABC transporter permease [Cryobacterium arcticum]